MLASGEEKETDLGSIASDEEEEADAGSIADGDDARFIATVEEDEEASPFDIDLCITEHMNLKIKLITDLMPKMT